MWRTIALNQYQSYVGEPVYPAPAYFGRAFQKILGEAGILNDYEPDLPDDTRELNFLGPYLFNLNSSTLHRCYFETDTLRMGMGPQRIKKWRLGGGLNWRCSLLLITP
jgi:hypothetical protein